MNTSSPLRLVRAAAFAAAATLYGSAGAAVLALAPHGANVRVVDTVSGNATPLEAAACCAVQAGSVAADTANDRVFFVTNTTSGPYLYTFPYGAAGSLAAVAITPAARVSHLDYDAAHTRLVGFAASDDGGIEVVRVDPASGVLNVTGALGPDCCVLRSGISAYAAGNDTLYAVGRRTSDSSDQLLAFAASGGTLQGAYDPGSARIVQLVADAGSLYALVYDDASSTLRAAAIAFAPTFTLTPIGSGAGNCCFVLAGPAAIDHASGAIVALTRAVSGSSAFSVESFSLGSGNASVGATSSAFGLFEDDAVLWDRIFADSFD